MEIWNHRDMLSLKIKGITRSDKGETITESVVSMLILMVLLLAVTTMTQTALRMTNASIQTATTVQEGSINDVMLSKYSSSGGSGEETSIKFTASAGPFSINTTHNVVINTGSGIIAFKPLEN